MISWHEIDNNLTENVNAYHYFDKDENNYKTVVKSCEKNKDGVRSRVTFKGNIKNNFEDRENRQAMYHLFESTEFAKKSESDKILEAQVNNSVSKDATYYGTFEGNYDGADGGGEYASLKNMNKAADGLDKIGDNLSYVPTPVTQAGGAVFSGAADVLRTISD